MSYFGIHNHTDYSNASVCGKDSITTIETLIDTAVSLGLKGVAITEHGIVSSHFNAIEYVREGKEKGTIPDDFVLGTVWGDLDISSSETPSVLVDKSRFNVELTSEEINILALLMKQGWV